MSAIDDVDGLRNEDLPQDDSDGNESSGEAISGHAKLTALTNLVVYGLAIVTGPILAQVLGSEGRGELAAVVVPTQTIAYLLLFGMPHATAFYGSRTGLRPLVMTGWGLAAFVNLPIVVAIAIASPWFLREHEPMLVPFFVAFLAAGLLFLPSTMAVDYLRAEKRMVAYNIQRSLPYLFYTVSIVSLAVIGQLTLTSALVATLASYTLGWATPLAISRGWPGRGFQSETARALLDYGWRSAMAMLSSMVVAKFDQLFLVGFVASEELGLYVVAATGAGISGAVATGVAGALFPHVRAAKADQADQWTRQAAKWTFLTSSVIALGLALVSPIALPIAFGDDFSGSVLPLILLLPGQVCADLASVYASRLEADGRPGAASKSVGVAAAWTLIGLFLFVDRYGIEGAAVVTSTAHAVNLTGVVLARRRQRTSSIERDLIDTRD